MPSLSAGGCLVALMLQKGYNEVILSDKYKKTKEPLCKIDPVMGLLDKKGFWTLSRRHHLIIAPPLIISKEELLNSMSILDDVLTELKL